MFGCGFSERLKLGRVKKLYPLRMNYISPTQNVFGKGRLQANFLIHKA